MKSVFLAGVALAAIVASPALAADLGPAPAPVYKQPPPPVIDTWTGFYVGANAGYSWGSSRINYANTTIAVQESLDLRGGTAGGQIGYNYQIGMFVWGVEADLNWADAKADGSCFVNSGISTTACSSGPGLLTFHTEQSWFGTVRGRVGVAAGGSFLPLWNGWGCFW